MKQENRFQNQAEIISTIQSGNEFLIKIRPQAVKTVILSEDITKSQRIEEFSVLAKLPNTFGTYAKCFNIQ